MKQTQTPREKAYAAYMANPSEALWATWNAAVKAEREASKK